MSGQRVRSWRTPKDCIVHRLSFRQDGDGIEVGYRCGNGTDDEHGRPGPHPSTGGGMATYPTVLLSGARSVDFRGASFSGEGARVGFVLSPAQAVCTKAKSETTVRCKLVGDTSLASLQGARRRKRRR